jgi:hypothetical protein
MSLFNSPVVRATDANNSALSGAKFYFYVSGTTTPATVYTSDARTTAASNPVVADSGGLFAPIYLDPTVTYRAILKDSAGTVIQDVDPISDGSLRADLASDSGSTLILHKSADAGTHGRTLRQWAAVGGFDEANVFNWIDDDLDAPITARTNATDLAVFIQAGLNSGRSLIRLPGVGSYKVSALTMSSEIELVGDGPLASGSVLLAANATGDVITTSGSGKNRISGIYFDSAVTRTSGSYIKMGGQGRGLVRDCEFWNGRDGVIIDAVDNITLDNIKLFSMTGDVIRVKQGFNHLLNYVHCDASPGSQPNSGLRIDNVGDITVSGCQFLHSGTALLIDVIAGGAVNSVNIDQSYFDTSTSPGIIRSTGTGVIQRLDIANTWFGNGTNDGLSISKTGSGEVSGIAIHNCRVCINGGDGLKIGTNVTNVRVTGGNFSQNTGSGISAAANSELYLGRRCLWRGGWPHREWRRAHGQLCCDRLCARHEDQRQHVQPCCVRDRLQAPQHCRAHCRITTARHRSRQALPASHRSPTASRERLCLLAWILSRTARTRRRSSRLTRPTSTFVSATARQTPISLPQPSRSCGKRGCNLTV